MAKTLDTSDCAEEGKGPLLNQLTMIQWTLVSLSAQFVGRLLATLT